MVSVARSSAIAPGWCTRRRTSWTSCPRGQPKAKAALHAIYGAEGREEARKAFDLFVSTYEAKYPKAGECLVKDREGLLAFYHSLAEHRRHIRTTNPIESTFAPVRQRHGRTKGKGSRATCVAMILKAYERIHVLHSIPNNNSATRFISLSIT
jgi:putative transposase